MLEVNIRRPGSGTLPHAIYMGKSIRRKKFECLLAATLSVIHALTSSSIHPTEFDVI
jgi:hypothetical protein